MKDEYLIWKRMQDDLKQQKEQLETQLFINNNISLMVTKNILKLERAGKIPKNDNTRPVAAKGTGNKG